MNTEGTNIHNWSKFNTRVSISVIIAFTLFMLSNLLIDPYDVFGFLNLKNGYDANERYNKIEHLLANPNKYNGYLLGSSKIGLIDPAFVEAVRPHTRYYNLGVFGGHAGDALKMLKAMKQNDVQIKEIIYGIDLFPYISTEKELNPAYRHHPIVSGMSKYEFFRGYLFVPSIYHSSMKVLHLMYGARDIVFDFNNTGHYRLTGYERLISNDQESYIKSKFRKVNAPKTKAAWNEEQFVYLQELKSWTDSNHIEAYYFIQPHNRLDYQSVILDTDLEYFLKRVGEIVGDVPNYMSIREWANDDTLYYDTRHYRPVLAQKIFEKMFNKPGSALLAHK